MRIAPTRYANHGKRSLAALIVLLATFSLGCANLYTPTPEIGSTPQPTAQPSPVVLTVPEPAPAKVIYAAIDRSSSYERFTRMALDRLVEVLPAVMAPGDRVVVTWVGSHSGDPAETFFNGSVADVPLPNIPPEVACQPALTQGTTMQIQKSQQEAEACLARQQERDVEAQRLVTAWEEERRQAVQRFLDQALPALANTTIEVDDSGTHVYEAIYQAANVLPRLGNGNTIKRKLLIMSDMQEYRAEQRDQVPLNLQGVDVIVAMFACEGPARCEQLKEEWTQLFIEAQANSIDFLVVDASVAETMSGPLLR